MASLFETLKIECFSFIFCQVKIQIKSDHINPVQRGKVRARKNFPCNREIRKKGKLCQTCISRHQLPLPILRE